MEEKTTTVSGNIVDVLNSEFSISRYRQKDEAKQYLQESYELYLQFNLKSEASKIKQLLDSI